MTKRWTALFGLAVAVALVACGGGDGDRATIGPTLTPAATTAPSGDQSPQVFDGVEVQQLAIGEEVELPDDVALLIEVGCIECHCPCVNGLVRVSRATSDELETKNLYVAPIAGPGARGAGAYILGGFVLNDDASEIVVGLCSRGYCGPLGAVTSDAQTTLFRSVDGGGAWEEIDVLEGAYDVVATTNDGVLLNGPPDPMQAAPSGYQLFPSGDSVELPAEADGSWPLSLPDGGLIWRTNDGRYVRNDGSELLAFDGVEQIRGIAPDYAGEGFVIEWSRAVDPPVLGFSLQYLVGIVGPDGHLVEAFSSPAGPLNFGGWLDSTRAIGNAYVIPPDAEFSPGFWRPVIFDLDSAIIQPIAMANTAEGFTQPAIFRGVLALVEGTVD